MLHCFGQVFAAGVAVVAAKQGYKLIDYNEEVRPPEEEKHRDADKVFYAGEEVERVNAFLSHVWMASRWLKAWVLYYYMNIDLVVVASLLTWVGLMASMVLKS